MVGASITRDRTATKLLEGYRNGMLAMALAVVLASIPSLLFNWTWALEPVSEKVMLATPVDLAQQLILHLGPAARPLALLGGFAVCLVLGGLAGAVAASPRGRLPGFVLPLAALFLLCIALFIVFPPLDPRASRHPGRAVRGGAGVAPYHCTSRSARGAGRAEAATSSVHLRQHAHRARRHGPDRVASG